MSLKNLKYKDIILSVILVLIVGLVSYKLIENYTFFFDILSKLWGLIVPFLYGLVIAYILNPIVKLFNKKLKLSNSMSILATYAILVGGIILIVVFCMPNVVESIVELSKNIPLYIQDAQNWLNEIVKNENVQSVLSSTGYSENINTIISTIGTAAIALLEGSVMYLFTISGHVVKVVLGLLISIYVLTDKEKFIVGSKRFTFLIFKKEKGEKIITFVRTYHKMIGTYIGIKAIDSAIIGGLAFILLTIVKSEYAFLLSIIVGISNMIPYFGPFIGEIVGFLFNVFVSPTKAIVVFLVLLSLQMFDGWYLDPKLIGDKVGVRPFAIILAVVIGGGFFGPLGMLLASPTAATLKIYYKKITEKQNGLMKEAENY